MTGRTPAEILLGRSPHTRLSLVHPCLSDHLNAKTEAKVGDNPSRSFSVDQQVFVRDLRPNSTDKWRRGKVTKRLGTLAYEVTLDGQIRKAHVDHMQPWVHDNNDAVTDSQTNDTNVPQGSSQAANDVSGILLHRARIPPKRLIEEMN